LRLNGEIKFIKDNVTEVRKLIRKVRVKTHNKKSIWNNVKDSVDFLFHSMEPTDNREIKIEFSISFLSKPTHAPSTPKIIADMVIIELNKESIFTSDSSVLT
jgi:hypothetical protein